MQALGSSAQVQELTARIKNETFVYIKADETDGGAESHGED